jgi:hypothetical protein
MEEERRIVIGDKILSRRDLFDGEQMARKEELSCRLRRR